MADLFINGRRELKDGSVEGAEQGRILGALQTEGERMWPHKAEFEWAGRGVGELSPQTYPEWGR